MLSHLPACLVRHFRRALFLALSLTKVSLIQSLFPSQCARRVRGAAISLLMLLLAGFMFAPAARAQISFIGVQETRTYFPSSDSLSPIAADANGDVFFVETNGTNTLLYEAPANGVPFIINESFPSVPSSIAVNQAGTTLYFIYYGSTANCSGGYVFIATAPVSTGIPANMPCSFSMKDGSSSFTVSFTNPTGLAVDPNGNLWIADSGGGDFFEIPAPVSATSVPTEIAALTVGVPYDIAVNGNGEVYFTFLKPSGSSEIQEVADISTSSFTNNLANSPVAASPIVTHVPSIQSGLTIDSSGHLYLGGSSADSEIVGSALVSVDEDFANGTEGLATDSNGNLYIAGVDATATPYVVELNKKAASFGLEPVDQSTTAQTLNFIITNATVGSIGVLTMGAPNLDFASAAGTTCLPQAYTSATACVVNVTFTPNAPGLRSGALVFYSGANNTGSVLAMVPLYGTGQGPEIAYYPGTALSFDPTVNSEQLKYPVAVALDGAGDLFIADYSNNRVVKVPAGAGTPTAIDPSVNSKTLASPQGVALDGAGDLFICDGNDRVVEVAIDGTLTAIAPQVNGKGFDGPEGIALDGAGDLFVADTYNDRVVEVPSGGGTPIAIDPTVSGKSLGYPAAVAVDAAGDLFIADYLNSRVVEVPPGGGTPTAIAPAPNGQALDGVVGVAVDAAGDLYISNFFTSQIVEVPANGAAPTAIDPEVNGFSVYGPQGVAVDAGGDLFIADYEDWRVVEVQHSVPPTLSFPTPTLVGSTDTSDGPQTVQIVNVGNEQLVIGPLTGSNPNYPPSFPENTGQSDLCSNGESLSLAYGCYISADFAPVSAGTNTGEVVLTDNASNQGNGVQNIPLTGANNQAAPAITWPTPAAIIYGTTLTGTQLDATANVAGGFAYTPAAGTVPAVGPQTLSVAFTPTDTTDYTTATATVTLTVNPATPAALYSPAPNVGTVLGTSNVLFQWTAGVATKYELMLGTTGVGASDLFSSGENNALSATVTTLPANGVTVFARLYYLIIGVWQHTDYTYVEGGKITLAKLSPTAGTVLSASTTFSWANGAGPTEYQLFLGTTGVGSNNLYSSGEVTATSETVALPMYGVGVYARLYQKINGVWQSADTTYTEGGSPTPATLSPAVNTVLSASQMFSWTNGKGPTEYMLYLGTTGVGSNNLYNSGEVTATSETVTLPMYGVKVFARLYQCINRVWQSADTTYTEGGSPTPATLSPAVNTVLSASQMFSWTNGKGPTEYMLYLGTTGVGSNNLYSSGEVTATSETVTLPMYGVKVFARLYQCINNVWQSADTTYTEGGALTLATLSPAANTVLSASQMFSWSNGAGPSEYELYLGTTGVGSFNLYSSGITTATSETVTLPTNGVKVYARLFQRVNGVWQSTDTTYTEGP